MIRALLPVFQWIVPVTASFPATGAVFAEYAVRSGAYRRIRQQVLFIRITGLASFPVKHLKINNSAHFCFSTLVNRAFFVPSIISNRYSAVFLTGKTAANASKAGAFTVIPIIAKAQDAVSPRRPRVTL